MWSQKFSESVAWGNCKLWESCMQCTRTNIRSLFNAKWRLLLTQLARQLFLFSKTPGDISKPFLWIWRKMACRKSMAELSQNVSEMQCFRISWVRSINELLFLFQWSFMSWTRSLVRELKAYINITLKELAWVKLKHIMKRKHKVNLITFPEIKNWNKLRNYSQCLDLWKCC